MKKSQFLIMFSLSVILLASCAQTASEKILGTWTVSAIESTAAMDDIQKEIFKETNNELIGKQQYIFSSDKLEMTLGQDKTEAVWQLSEDGKNLRISNPDGNEFSYTISELSDNKLILTEELTQEKYSVKTTLEKK